VRDYVYAQFGQIQLDGRAIPAALAAAVEVPAPREIHRAFKAKHHATQAARQPVGRVVTSHRRD